MRESGNMALHIHDDELEINLIGNDMDWYSFPTVIILIKYIIVNLWIILSVSHGGTLPPILFLRVRITDSETTHRRAAYSRLNLFNSVEETTS